jgi:hypothetical protein
MLHPGHGIPHQRLSSTPPHRSPGVSRAAWASRSQGRGLYSLGLPLREPAPEAAGLDAAQSPITKGQGGHHSAVLRLETPPRQRDKPSINGGCFRRPHTASSRKIPQRLRAIFTSFDAGLPVWSSKNNPNPRTPSSRDNTRTPRHRNRPRAPRLQRIPRQHSQILDGRRGLDGPRDARRVRERLHGPCQRRRPRHVEGGAAFGRQGRVGASAVLAAFGKRVAAAAAESGWG